MSGVHDALHRIASPGRSPPAHTLCHPADKAAQSSQTVSVRPYIGVLAVLLGSVIARLDSRIRGDAGRVVADELHAVAVIETYVS
jgi:hypothetical protein